MKTLSLTVVALLLAAATPSLAQDGSAQPVFLQSAQTNRTIQGAVQGRNQDRYQLTLRRGQHVSVALNAADPAVNFNLVDTRGRILHSSARSTVYRYESAAPADGVYTIVVYLLPGVAINTGRAHPYSLRVGAQGGSRIAPPQSGPRAVLPPAGMPNLTNVPPPRRLVFECGALPAITAVFYNGNPAMVDLTRNERTLRATQAMSASGARYVGGNGLQFWNKGREAQVNWPGGESFICRTP